jgi:hypothetical protein
MITSSGSKITPTKRKSYPKKKIGFFLLDSSIALSKGMVIYHLIQVRTKSLNAAAMRTKMVKS